MSEESRDLDLIQASLRAGASDLATYVETLAAALEAALPARTKVQRKRRGLTGPKAVVSVSVEAAGARYVVERHGDHVHTARATVSGGIVLKTEPLEPDAWIVAMSDALAAEAQRSEAVRQALERLLI